MLSFVSLIAVFSFLIAGNLAFAADSTSPTGHRGFGGRAPGVFGTVSAISGNTLTVTSKMRSFNRPGNGTDANTAPSTAVATVYSVDDTNATVMKNNATSTIANIAVGDTVMVQGTINGTTVTATMIRDGIPQMGNRPQGTKPQSQGLAKPIIQGNGQPVVGGSVTAVNGSTLSITNKSNVSYTVDATSATIQKGRATSTIESITVGDNVVVQGTVNGNSIVASSIIDQAANNNSSANTVNRGVMGGFFGAIGGFFHHLFGFF